MTEIVAKPVVKNKFWIVEESGSKIGHIQAVDHGGVVFVHEDQRESFPSLKLLSKKYNIVISRRATKDEISPDVLYEIYGYPTPHRPHNMLYNVKKKLPVFTKSAKSKSYFCAGYYAIKFNQNWSKSYCPKAITLNRYKFAGPFRTQQEAMQRVRELNGQ
jgi:hypothetical protein